MQRDFERLIFRQQCDVMDVVKSSDSDNNKQQPRVACSMYLLAWVESMHPFLSPHSPYATAAIMCQLLGMNCASPTDFTFSFRGFCRRGGETDKHEHGWGLAVYEGHGVRTFLDTKPAASSPVAQFVESYPIHTYVRAELLVWCCCCLFPVGQGGTRRRACIAVFDALSGQPRKAVEHERGQAA